MIAPLLITGGSGQIGGALARLCAARGIAYGAPPRDALDLADADTIAATLRAQRWRAVVNCAAYVAVDRAEDDIAQAMAINRDGTRLLAQLSAAQDLPMVHLSTDYVFDGTHSAPYRESDPVSPINAYGRSKLAGELAVREANPRHLILRTAWVVSHGGGNFLDTMLRLGATRDHLNIVADQRGCPTSADDIAEAIIDLIDGGHVDGRTLHFVNGGEASWFDLASHIFARAAGHGLPVPSLAPIQTASYPTPAARPANSRLDWSAFADATGRAPRDWRTAIDDILTTRLAGVPVT